MLPSSGYKTFKPLLETIRFEVEDDYEYQIWPKVFSRLLKIFSPDSFTLPFFTRKVSTVTFSEGGYTLSRSQKDKTSNIW